MFEKSEERDQLQQWREQDELIKILMKDYNLSKASVYRYLGKTFDNSIHFMLFQKNVYV